MSRPSRSLAPRSTPLPAVALPGPAAPAQYEEDLDLPGLLDVLANSRALIIGVVLTALIAAGGYAYLSMPVYRADALIQVEPRQSTEAANHVLGELAGVFSSTSSSSAEMEILRSRLVVGEATDSLQLYVRAEPRYLPVLGRWLAQRAGQLSDPVVPGLFGYVYGTESIDVGLLEVPPELENQPLTIVATAEGFDLLGPQGHRLARGAPGQIVEFNYGSGTGTVLLNALHGQPGARFEMERRSRLAVIESLQQTLVIEELNKPSGVLALSLEDTDPVRAAAIVNAVGDAYVRQNTERRAAEAEKSLVFLDEFLPELRRQLDEADNRYTAFRDQHGTFNLGTEGTLSLETSVGLQTRRFELQQRRLELSAQYGPMHPMILAVDEQIAALNTEIGRLDERIRTLPALEQQLLNLVRDVNVNSELYAGLLNSAQQLRLVKEGKVGSARLVDAAIAPEAAVKPRKLVVLLVSAVAGLVLGVALALLRNLMRPGLKTPADIEQALGLDVLATVPRATPAETAAALPRPNRNDATRTLAARAPDAPAIESLRGLRTALHFGLRDAPNNIIMITGPTAGIGKTFTSSNLATVFAAAGKKVLLVDTDLRNGRIHQSFGLPRGKGLSELIQGHCELDEALWRDAQPNVDVITTGTLPRTPAELLLSPRTSALLQEWAQHYDVVILDTAPVLTMSDPLALASCAGTLFLLARAEVTTLAELDESMRRLARAGASVNGVILNDFNNAHHRFSMRYGTGRAAYGGYPAK